MRCFVFLLLLLWLGCILHSSRREEGFTIALRDGVLCQPYYASGVSSLSHTITLLIEGYNYSSPPKVYRDGKLLVPLQSEWDYQSMAYYYLLDAPRGWKESRWVLETTDRVAPRIHVGDRRVGVSLIRERDGAYRWLLH